MRHAKLAATLLATTALVVGAVEIEADRIARADVAALLGRHPDIRVAGVGAEPFTGRLTLRGLSAGSSAVRVTIGRLDLPLPAGSLGASLGLVAPAAASPFDDKPAADNPPAAEPDRTSTPAPDTAIAPVAPPAAATPGVASAQDVTIVVGTTTVRIKRIDMTGTTLSNADLAALIDPKNPEPLAARLAKLNAAAIVVPEILADDTTAGSERHAIISQVLLSGATAGKIAAGSTGAISFAIKDGTGDTSGQLAALQAAAVDLPQLARIFGEVRTDESEAIKPLYDSVTATGIDIRNGKTNSTLTVASLKETGAKGRPLKTDLIVKAHPAPLSDAEKAAAFDDMTHSFAIGSIEASGIATHGDTPEGPNTFGLASVSMHDFADAKVGGLGLQALHFESPTVKLGIGAITVGPFVLPKPKGVATPYATSQMVPSTASADLRQFDVDVTAVDKAGGPPTHSRVSVAHAGFASQGDPDDLPKTAKLTIDNLGFDLPKEPGQAQPLVDMGYSHLDVSSALTTSYDAGSHDLEVHPLSLNGVDMGSLGIGLKLSNVTKGVVSSNAEIAKASALSVLAKGLTLDVANGGLVDRAIAWKAKQDGLDVAREKALLVDFFADKLPASLGNSANVKIVGTALAKFVTEPKTLHIGIVSQSGLGVGSMALLSDPGLLIDTLEVKASANE